MTAIHIDPKQAPTMTVNVEPGFGPSDICFRFNCIDCQGEIEVGWETSGGYGRRNLGKAKGLQCSCGRSYVFKYDLHKVPIYAMDV